MKQRLVCSILIGSAVMLMGLAQAFADNWPTWRGPTSDGVTLETDLPVQWSPTENVRWRVDLPERGNSSPIVWGDQVFVSQAVTAENRRTLMCFDRSSGRLLWQSGVVYAEPEATPEDNPYCSGSPATDGERVYVCFGSAGVFAYNFEGGEVWRRDLGKLNHRFGNAVSPVLTRDLCILNFGPDANARLIALSKATGQIEWEVVPPKPEPSEVQAGNRGGPGSPGGPGGPGGPGRFGPGSMLARSMITQGDTNGDQSLTKQEFAELAYAWFDKLDPEQSGKLSPEQFAEGLNDVLAPPPGPGERGAATPGGGRPPRGGRPGFGAGRFLGPGLFAVMDFNEDGSLTRIELKAAFEKWGTEWGTSSAGRLSEEQLGAGLDSVLPPPSFGGPGGPGGRPGGEPDLGASWSTPILINTGEHDELVVNTAGRLTGFDPVTGRQLWVSKGLGGSIYSSAVWGEGFVFASTGGPGGGPAIAVRPGGRGDVSDSHLVWRRERVKSAIGSGVIRDGHVYIIGSDGVALCVDARTGDTIWEERLRGGTARGSSWSSMLLAGNKIYVPNQSGEVFVLRASPQFEIIATNSIGEPTNASLAASNGELFMRTDQSLWCFSNLN